MQRVAGRIASLGQNPRRGKKLRTVRCVGENWDASAWRVRGKSVSTTAGVSGLRVLNIASVQDTSQSAAHQESSGGGFSISQGGGSASFSTSHGNANGSYAGVNEQSGIHAGSDGFDVNVKGSTNLHGAYIASDADACGGIWF